MKRIAAVLTIAGALFGIGAPAAFAAGPQACVHVFVDINGTQQTVDQCAP
jgi:hypothetical protein